MTRIKTIDRGIGDGPLTHVGPVHCEACTLALFDREHLVVESWPSGDHSWGMGFWHAKCYAFAKSVKKKRDPTRTEEPLLLKVKRLEAENRMLSAKAFSNGAGGDAK